VHGWDGVVGRWFASFVVVLRAQVRRYKLRSCNLQPRESDMFTVAGRQAAGVQLSVQPRTADIRPRTDCKN